MKRILLHLYGPFAIQSYGVMIAIGLIITLYFLQKDKIVQKLMSQDQLASLFQVSFLAGISGGRIWYLITNWHEINHWYEMFEVWNGGLSIQGCIIGILIVAPLFLKMSHIPVFQSLDRVALYTPMLQSISRLGCFFAGCCHGIETHVPWAISYSDPESLAPLHTYFHPTQIYSVILLALSFLFLQTVSRMYKLTPGVLLGLYIMCVSFERFIVDFWRGDREMIFTQGLLKYFSIQQLLAILLFLGAMFIIGFLTKHKKNK